jgi:Zn-dependent peptidase ImmA (M78 family)
MRAGSQEVSIAPSVLKWARVSLGKSIDEVAKRLDISGSVVENWETGDKQPTLKQLRELTTFYKRPLAAFFLAEPPQEPPFPVDFRTLPKTVRKPFSEKTRLAIRRARRLQALAGELNKTLEAEMKVKIGEASLSDDPETVAIRARASLGVGMESQFNWKDEATALSEWKRSIEQTGPLVFELPFPFDEGRAFSFADRALPAIVLNSNDAVNGRIFSLFHEFGHLLLGQSGICDLSEEDKVVEQFCNRFAGDLLVPRKLISQHSLVKVHAAATPWDEPELQRIAHEFKVSREVVLLQILSIGRTTEAFYKRKCKEWKREREVRSLEKRRSGRRVPARQCVRENGVPFTNLVLESARQDKITYRDVSDYLSVGLKHLPTVESLVGEQRTRYG